MNQVPFNLPPRQPSLRPEGEATRLSSLQKDGLEYSKMLSPSSTF
jgi:hypothetical protein